MTFPGQLTVRHAVPLAAGLLLLGGCGSGPAAVTSPPATQNEVDAGPATPADVAPEAPSPSVPPAAAPDADRERPEATASQTTVFEAGAGGGGTARTCITIDGAVLPRCASAPSEPGCPLAVPATAGVALEVVASTGYEGIAAAAFDEVIPQLLSCYGESLVETADAASTVQVTLDVSASGCAAVRSTSGDWLTRRLRDCTCGVLTWRSMPAPAAEAGGTLELQIVFSP